MLRQSGSRTSLGISGSQTSLCCGDYATEGIEAVEAVDAHAHEKLLDYYAGGDYSQLTSLPRRTPSEAVPARPTTLEFLDLIVEGCATQWIDLRRAASCDRDEFREILTVKTKGNRHRHIW